MEPIYPKPYKNSSIRNNTNIPGNLFDSSEGKILSSEVYIRL